MEMATTIGVGHDFRWQSEQSGRERMRTHAQPADHLSNLHIEIQISLSDGMSAQIIQTEVFNRQKSGEKYPK